MKSADRTICVAIAVIVRDGRILICQRPANTTLGGLWEFPGGKIEAGETPEECLARELKEELNIEVLVGEFCTEVTHAYGNKHINLKAYYCTIVGGEIKVSVHDKYKWVRLMDLLGYDLLPADVPIARKVMEDHGEGL